VRLKAPFAVLALSLAPVLLRAYVTVNGSGSSFIMALADDGIADHTGFWATVLTPPYPGGQNILYGPNAVTYTGTSHLVFDLNGSVVDMQTSEPVDIPVGAANGPGPDGLGDSITMARNLGSLEYGGRYTIVVDPHSGVDADAVQIQAWVTNNAPAGSAAANVGLRVLLDTMVGGNDGSPLSYSDGAGIVDDVTLYQAATDGVPSDWWSYDTYPSPNLTARGVAWGNQFGAPATQPDAVEFAAWADVEAMGYWEVDPNPGVLFTNSTYYAYPDTAVVLWYTNTGQAGYVDAAHVAQGDGYSVDPRQTLIFTTYVGLNQSPLGASPTPYITYTDTETPTVTLTPTHTLTPTISPTSSVSPTWTVSPTFSVSPTRTPSWTVSPTFTVSPTATMTFTDSPSFTVSDTFSASPTATPTPSLTPSVTVSDTYSASPTVTPTPSVSPSSSVSPTASASPTPVGSPTPAGYLVLTAKYPNPDPTRGPVWLPYTLTCDAQVNIRIYDVAGETVRDLAPFAGLTGANEEYWDGLNSSGQQAASGVYIAHITAQALGETRGAWVKLAIVR